MNRKKYYYEITDAAGEVMYMEIDAKPKDPKLLCEFLHIEGTAREITKQEYLESTGEILTITQTKRKATHEYGKRSKK